MSTSITLGPFELYRRFAQGGMAEVWQGIHVAQQVPVAVKVILGPAARDPHYFNLFRREVQAVARLSHSGIVRVFDYGSISFQAARASSGRLVAESPYLVMEFASGGSLDDIPISSWSQVRDILHTLLAALGHAHARHVVHRDLKPSNVLVSGFDDLRPGLKLTDFGIAHSHDVTTRTIEHNNDNRKKARVEGTIAYMPPEQWRGDWRDYGPWTDLYALGVMAWELVSGRIPFDGPMHEIMYAHMHRKLPRLRPLFDVPVGFEGWMHQMTAKSPSERFRRASDAAWHLGKLDPTATHAVGVALASLADLSPSVVNPQAATANARPRGTMVEGQGVPARPATIVESGEGPAERAPRPRQTVFESEAPATHADPARNTLVEGPASPSPRAGTLVEDIERTDVEAQRPDIEQPTTHPVDTVHDGLVSLTARPPIAATWRDGETGAGHDVMKLVGAGLGLYGLREVPMVDRDTARDTLWNAIQEVEQHQQPRVVVLNGEPGVGKSRLAQWLCELAHETGAASVLSTIHEPVQTHAGGLARMVSDHLRCAGLRGDELLEHVTARVKRTGVEDPYEWHALYELIALDSHDSSRTISSEISVQFTSPIERYALLERFLERVARDRPVIVWLDDIQWGHDSLAFVQHVVSNTQRQVPIVFLLTLRGDLLGEDELLAEKIDILSARPETVSVDIAPLTAEDNAALVENLLGLSGELAHQVAARTAGHPLFAVQLVGDWVQRGVLEVGSQGFVLKAGTDAELPDDLHALWADRIERILLDVPDASRVVLECAALLGREVVSHELNAVTQVLGVTVPATLVESLVNRQLAVLTSGGWSFAHGMLRESLVRSAREAGRWLELNRATARILGEIYDPRWRGVAERRARHLVAGEDFEGALGPLLQAARERNAKSEYNQALGLIDERDALMSGLALAESDARWGEGWTLRANIYRMHWDFEQASVWSTQTVEVAHRHSWVAILPQALSELAHVARQRGELQLAQTYNKEALERFQALGDEHGASGVVLAMAIVDRQQGDLESSAARYQEARSRFEKLGDMDAAAKCLAGLGNVCRQQQDLDTALSYYQAAHDRFEQTGNRHELANILNNLAEVARYRDDLTGAEEGYRRALELHQSIGSNADLVPRLNLSLVLQKRGKYDQAREFLLAGLERLTRQGRKALMAWVHVNLLPCAVHAEELMAFDVHLRTARTLLQDSAMVDNDMAQAAQTAGGFLAKRGDSTRAKAAYALALEQWTALGNAEAATEVEGIIQGL